MHRPSCLVVMYHYVREPGDGLPPVHGLRVDEFAAQVDALRAQYEMASLESALAFWRGDYQPGRDLCLLTFDDGLLCHYERVMPVLAERGLTGIFFLITSCLEDGSVAGTHQGQLLMADLGFDEYRARAEKRLRETGSPVSDSIDPATAQTTYRWDEPEVACFKYLMNHHLAGETRERLLCDLFSEHYGEGGNVCSSLYLNWAQAREMQESGMILGGHSHEHRNLAKLSPDEQARDIARNTALLRQNLIEQTIWPFSYPYGKADTFTPHTQAVLRQSGFACAFATIPGNAEAGGDVFALNRQDTKSI